MQRFTQLYFELDATTRTTDKVAALERYFSNAPPEQAAWALFFLTGKRIRRSISTRLLREWATVESGYPAWLLEECYDAVGDLAETLALILPFRGEATRLPLDQLIEQRLLPLATLTVDRQRALIARTWRELDARQRLVWHKLIGGEHRVGAARTLVIRAVARVAGVTPQVMAHRLMGNWEPTPSDYERLLRGEGVSEIGQPYPFYLAYALDVR